MIAAISPNESAYRRASIKITLGMLWNTQHSWVSPPVVQGQQMLDGCSSSRRAPSALPLLILVDQLAQVPLQPMLPSV